MPTGSLANPAMSYPGSAVILQLTGGTVRAEVDGPTYPTSTKVGADQMQCTFTVTFRDATATIDTMGSFFNVLDSQGGIHQMKTTLPARFTPGAVTTAKVTGTLPSGEGLLRFYPSTAGAIAAWDYVAETD